MSVQCLYQVYRPIKISQKIFEKGHSRNISMKLFQNMTSSFREDGFLRICSCLYSESSPHSPEPCSWIDKNLTIFEKGHSRNIVFEKGHPSNIPVKLFQNLTSS